LNIKCENCFEYRLDCAGQYNENDGNPKCYRFRTPKEKLIDKIKGYLATKFNIQEVDYRSINEATLKTYFLNDIVAYGYLPESAQKLIDSSSILFTCGFIWKDKETLLYFCTRQKIDGKEYEDIAIGILGDEGLLRFALLV